MTYRKWAYEDVLEIAEIEKECFKDPWSYRMLADSFFGEYTYTVLAEDAEKIVGYGFLLAAGEEADIANVAVRGQYRRRGVARELLSRLEAQAASLGVVRVFLEVRVSNAAAMALYLKCGYVGVYVRPRYYEDGEDALVMQKVLSEK